MKKLLSFEDVLLTPKFSTIKSRKDVDLSQSILGIKINSPYVSSNMDTVTEDVMANAMWENGSLAALHRFMDINKNVEMFKKCPQETIVSIGLGDKELQRAEALYQQGANNFLIDVAHGASMEVVNQFKELRKLFKSNVNIIVGNFATAKSIKDFKYHLEGYYVPDAYKCGIGGGCFVSGTRILMSNGTYKNIEEIKIGDKVINKNGISVNVIATKNSGIKKVIKYKTNNFYKPSFATPDHKHWVGDYSTIKDINNHSLVKTLDKLTKKDESKYKWKRLDETEKTVCLLPKYIKFEMNDDFLINFKDYYKKESNFDKSECNNEIKPSYELGYIFGTYLGDGCQNQQSYNKSTMGQVSWFFGLTELDIANKLVSCIKKVFNLNSSIEERKNIQLVHFHSQPIARLLEEFGKKTNKHLPEKYLVNNKQYLNGLYDGLMDSDGCYNKDKRNSFTNTSSQLVELYGILHYTLNGVFPSMYRREPTAGGLLNCKVENCNPAFEARSVIHTKNYQTKDYQVVRINSYEECEVEVETFDIEVDCETHSFIANNVIVHNSHCTTRVVTKYGYPTLASILDCAQTKEILIADGGIKNSGDCVASLAAGASLIMIGKLFAGTDESPGYFYGESGEFYNQKPLHLRKIFKKYRGSASQESYEVQGKTASHRAPEGESSYVPYVGTVKNVIENLNAGIASACSYVGANNLDELRENAEFVEITTNGVTESGSHGRL